MTLSIEQKRLAEERIREAGLEGRVRVHLMDYREIPENFEKAFDAFISIEMLEVKIIHLFSPFVAATECLFSFFWGETACRCKVLQPLLQTSRFCSQIQRCYSSHHIVDLSRIKVLKLSVRTSPSIFFIFLFVADY